MASISVGKTASEVINFDSIEWDIQKDKVNCKSLKIDKSKSGVLPKIESVGRHIIVMQKAEQVRAIIKNKKAVPIKGGNVRNSRKRNEARFAEKYPSKNKSAKSVSKDI